MVKILTVAFLVLASIFCLSCSGSAPKELQKKDLVTGTGELAEIGNTLTMHYSGWLYENGRRTKKFDSSLGGEPLSFKLGAGEVIEGWDRGIEGMRVGGKRDLIIPAQMGYGAAGAPPDIPPNTALNFEVQLVGVQK